MKSHIARSGKNAGRYVPCPAKIHCRIAPDDEHANFAGQQEMDAYNNIADAAPEFYNGSMSSVLFGQAPDEDYFSPDDPWESVVFDDVHTAKDGGCMKFNDTFDDMLDVEDDLLHGKKLDREDYESVLADAVEADDALWGSGDGLSQSKPSDYTSQDGTTVHLDKGWEHRMSTKSYPLSPDEGAMRTISLDVFSNGSTAFSIQHDPNKKKSVLNIYSRKHKSVAASIPLHGNSITPSKNIEKMSKLIDKMGEIGDKKYGVKSYNLVILKDKIGFFQSRGDGDETSMFPVDDAEKNIPEMASTVKEFMSIGA